MKNINTENSKYRSKPFWAWNGKLDKKELKRQIEIFKEMGFGGFFMHSRTGLATEYMGNEWFEAVNYCADVAKDLGLEAYLYDEDRYPSGTCGGYAVMNPEYAAKYLAMAEIPEGCDYCAEKYKNTVAVFTGSFEDGQLMRYEKFTGKNIGKIMVFYTGICEGASSFNGYPYLDTLSAQAVNNFIKYTHERYKEHCGENLGKKLYGIFTDEVSFGSIYREELEKYFWRDTRIPYTDKLFAEFEKKFGYDLKERLPELFFKTVGEELRQIMWQFVELLQCMFLENFAKPYYEWCKNNNIKFCGHILQEETLTAQSVRSGSVMRFYEYMDYPGIDVLCENSGNEWKIKQAVSVCKQLGKEFTLSECFGATGWHMDFERYKRIFDQGAVYGINFRVPHLSWYTMEGRGKRDYPASISYQSCWYKDFKYCEDYFARVESLLDRGKYVTDVCLIYPVESVWAMLSKNGVTGEASLVSATDPGIIEVEKIFSDTFYSLIGNSTDFDYADEDILSRYYKIGEDEKGVYLAVGKMKYRTAIVSGCVNIRKETYRILCEFAERGGRVIINGNMLKYVGFEKAELDAKFIFTEKLEDLCDVLKRQGQTLINLPEGLLYNIRKTDDGFVMFVLNGGGKTIRGEIETNIRLPIYEYDLRVGEIKKTKFSSTGNGVRIPAEFLPFQEKMFIFTGNSDIIECREKEKMILKSDCINNDNGKRAVEIPSRLKFSLSEENVMLLDSVTVKIDGEIFAENEYVLTVDEKLRKHFGVEVRDEMMLQPWFREKFDRAKYERKLALISVSYSFNAEIIPDEVYFCIEQSELYEIFINGVKIDKISCGVWIDPCFDKLEVPFGVLKKGINKIELKGVFTERNNLECAYLIGGFGVSADGKNITKLPEMLEFGDICTQGLPFYSGKIIYHTGLKEGEYSVKFDKCNGACQQVSFGTKTQTVPFAPYETDMIKLDGELEFIVSLTRYNTFGPLRNKNTMAEWNGPFNYLDMHDGNFDNKYHFIRQGILSKPRIMSKDC